MSMPPTSSPKFSIIIPVYRNWPSLNECLTSLAQQINAPSFEIIIVDDGTEGDIPKFISKWEALCSVMITRQSHAGIAAARNRGIRASNAAICLFVDSDCRLDTHCLQMLERTVDAFPGQHYFQLHLVGDCGDGLVGKTEELRLRVVQHHFVRPDGSIRYLNTAAFALRRNEFDSGTPLFSPFVTRGEDTLLLANLITIDKVPLFVSEAIVQHAIQLNLIAYLCKTIRSAYLEGVAFDIISAGNIKIRARHRERLRMLGSAWHFSADSKIGRMAWFVLLTRQVLRMLSSFCYQRLRDKSNYAVQIADSL